MKKFIWAALIAGIWMGWGCTEPDTGTCDFIVKTTNSEYPNFGAYVETVANQAACKDICIWSDGRRSCCHFHPFAGCIDDDRR